jgi:hypothetical protein
MEVWVIVQDCAKSIEHFKLALVVGVIDFVSSFPAPVGDLCLQILPQEIHGFGAQRCDRAQRDRSAQQVE